MKTSRACELCAEKSLTCCQLNPGQEEFCFPLSGLEVELLKKDLPKTDGCFVLMPNSDVFIQTLTSLFPLKTEILQQRFPPGSSHLRLATDAEGKCVFLGERGCVLSDDHRPLLCRLFPFWVMGKQFYIFAYEKCLPIRTAQSFPEILAAFGMTVETLEGKWKASQNRSEADRRGVIAGLRALGTPEGERMAEIVSAALNGSVP